LYNQCLQNCSLVHYDGRLRSSFRGAPERPKDEMSRILEEGEKKTRELKAFREKVMRRG